MRQIPLSSEKLTSARCECRRLVVALERVPADLFAGHQKTIEVLKRLQVALAEAELRQQLREAEALAASGTPGQAALATSLRRILENPAELRAAAGLELPTMMRRASA